MHKKPRTQSTEKFRLTRAIISVSDKSQVNIIGKYLGENSVEIISTGGTAAFLRKSHLGVTEVSDLTGVPEMMSGRVKTLHPKIHGGILFRRSETGDLKDLKDHGISEINLVIVNLYPFRKSVLSGKKDSQCIENIDIGGPTLIRAGAKNYENVCVIVDPYDYGSLMTELRKNEGHISIQFSKDMAVKAFKAVSDYDNDVQFWLNGDYAKERKFPPLIRDQVELRYGENPHQKASLLIYDQYNPSIASAKQTQGKELSYNNYIDADAAFKIISEFRDVSNFACVIVKHKNPCGVAIGETLKEAYLKANFCDPISAFGGIIAVNAILDEETAQQIVQTFTEVIIAPKISEKAKLILGKKKNIRLLETSGLLDLNHGGKSRKEISGGILLQQLDVQKLEMDKIINVTELKPSNTELQDLFFAWKILKHVNSNAIIIAKNGQTRGIGGGETSRLDSVKIAVKKAQIFCKNSGESLKGSIAASDAFFPFVDGISELDDVGIKVIIQTGGSIKDKEIITEANKKKMVMVFTGIRHFSH